MKTLLTTALMVFLFMGCKTSDTMTKGEMTIADSTYHRLGEGALWDSENNRLFYVDIVGKKLFEMYPESGEIRSHEMPSMIGTVVCHTEQEVLVALTDGIYKYNLLTKNLEFLICPPENDSTQRFNDGKCDPSGRLWVGTMSLIGGKQSSHLFCYDQTGKISMKLEGITTSNGIVWSADAKKMYYIDTPTRKVMEFAFDNATGEIHSPRVAVTIADSLGFPDGMAIDAAGNLWVCMWGGSAVCCFDPSSGSLLERIPVPAKNVTSCAFGGQDLNELYITTARIGTSEEGLSAYPNAGSLFKIDLNTVGRKSFCY